MAKSDRICVGAVSGAFGVRGEVRLRSFCAEPTAIADYAPLTTEDGKRSFQVTLTGVLNNALSARLSGIETREQAEALRGTELYAERARLPAPEEDEFYYTDLIGLAVLDAGGNRLGVIKAVLNHGASDLLEVMGPGMKTPILLTFSKAVVPTVDIAGGRVIVDLPDEV